MATQIDPQTHVSDIATAMPRSTRVFHRYGIDFCCGGKRPLADACGAQGADLEAVLQALEDIANEQANQANSLAEAPLSQLVDHIITQFHEPAVEELPRLVHLAQKVARAHGDREPALHELEQVVLQVAADLQEHMAAEEQTIFPQIRSGAGSELTEQLATMEADHTGIGEALAQIRTLTNAYHVPEGACTSWRALWAGLEDLERDCHEHIHLENNILFPRATSA